MISLTFSFASLAGPFTAEGEKFLISSCSKDTFYAQGLANVRKYQELWLEWDRQNLDIKIKSALIREQINREEDELFKWRKERDFKISDDSNALLRSKILDFTYDIIRVSALEVFNEYRFTVEEIRLVRRLYETCQNNVQKAIN